MFHRTAQQQIESRYKRGKKYNKTEKADEVTQVRGQTIIQVVTTSKEKNVQMETQIVNFEMMSASEFPIMSTTEV